MFDVEYKGANAVVFTTKNTKVVFDPKLSIVGAKDVPSDKHIMVLTEARLNVEGAVPKLRIISPGEYEIADVAVTGVAARRHIDTEGQGKQAVAYRLTIGDTKIAVIGNIAPKLDEHQLEKLGVIDVLVIPVGGNGYTLDATDAAAMVRQIEPRAVIPVHYADDGLRYEVPQDDLDRFVKELGANVIEEGTKWKVKNSSSIPEQLSIIKLSKS